MNQQQIIMNFTVPPSSDDLAVIARETLENLPEELAEFCDEMAIEIQDIPDESIEIEQQLEDPYELLALYRSGKQISPGIESKIANDDDLLILYRRPILDVWCETGEDLRITIRDIMIEELGRNFEFSDDEIEEMSQRHHQGML